MRRYELDLKVVVKLLAVNTLYSLLGSYQLLKVSTEPVESLRPRCEAISCISLVSRLFSRTEVIFGSGDIL